MKVYINPITMGIMVSLVIIYLAFIPIMVHQYRRYGSLRTRGNIVLMSLILYMITAWFMTILPLPSIEAVQNMKAIRPNLRPFLFIETFLNSTGFVLTKPGTWLASLKSSSFYTVAFNVVLTIPFGVYLRKYFKLKLHWVAVLGFCLSLFYEFAQYTGLYGFYPRAYRFADVDDLIVNTSGAVLGYFLAALIDRMLPDSSKDKDMMTEEVSKVRRLLALVVDSIAISVLFQISRLVIYWNKAHRDWDLVIFVVCEVTVFMLLPLLTKKKKTMGMLALKIYLVDQKGQDVKASKALLHNLLVGIWLHTIFGIQGKLPEVALLTIILQLSLLLWFVLFIIKSLTQRKVCYFWEAWLDAYMMAYLPKEKVKGMQEKVQL